MEARLFFGGMPYGIDIKRLEEAFPVKKLAEGRVIEHDALSAALGEKRGTSRYYGVINAWIGRMLNSNGIYIAWQPGDGIKVLDPAGVLNRAETITRQKMRQTGKAVKIFAWVDRSRLDSIGQQRLDHQIRVAQAIKTALDEKRREFAVELGPVKSLPRLRIA
jgi:hypothetical protein